MSLKGRQKAGTGGQQETKQQPGGPDGFPLHCLLVKDSNNNTTEKLTIPGTLESLIGVYEVI